MNGLGASASNITVRIELPKPTDPAVAPEPAATGRRGQNEGEDGGVGSSGTSTVETDIPVIIVNIAGIKYEDRSPPVPNGKDFWSWVTPSPSSGNAGGGGGYGSPAKLRPLVPTSHSSPAHPVRPTLKSIMKHVNVSGLTVQLLSGAPFVSPLRFGMSGDGRIGDSQAIREKSPAEAGGEDGISPPLPPHDLSSHLLWGADGRPGIDISIGLGLNWESQCDTSQPREAARQLRHSPPSVISIDLSLSSQLFCLNALSPRISHASLHLSPAQREFALKLSILLI